ncbi:MAG: hypothetical protein KDI33_15695 [Halioglobus sp.]|nr:hypothetical protein [Halioglobus sp.]
MSTDYDVTQFGIQPEDEFHHPFSADHADWNESYFFDWYDASGSNAGHCRIGWHPVQQRILFWLYLYNGSEWLVIEEYRLPFSSLQLGSEDSSGTPGSAFSYEGWGLAFKYQPLEALRRGRLTVSGFARVICGPRQGQIKPIQLDLAINAIGPPYSRGAGAVDSHSAEHFSTDRYEQPTQVQGNVTIDGETTAMSARGERDHSWGPRPWDMQWQFLVVNNERFSMLATQVEIPGWPVISMGYYHGHGEAMEPLAETELALTFNAADPTQAVSGSFNLLCESGRRIQGNIETISGTEIDITHTFATPHRSEYRRSLIRCTFDDGSESVGWLECNRETG